SQCNCGPQASNCPAGADAAYCPCPSRSGSSSAVETGAAEQGYRH
uniref:Cuticle collagen (Fragments) n=1 Tax=Caenorhabditis elegans TaxID=6239 RepID=Q9TXE8_CAEEL